MSLAPGSRLGPYEILAPLGAGGMGEVYRARDTKLGREVALKVLPPSVAQDPERLARFEREAQLLASLNHPHIAAIHGVEDSTDTKALVLELVEGSTLQDRIAEGALPVAEALSIGRQIAEALEAAHEKGVVHRDLKPANVKITVDGDVKVLDFGLAKALDPAGSAAPLTSPTLMNSPTLTAAGTQLGVILGTAAYMAPEQARGAVVDKRADIWAFGAVLWEMLTGRRLFQGDTVTDTLAGVLKTEIDWKALPSSTPPNVLRLLERCLTRDRKQRLHDIGDARLELEEALVSRGVSAVPIATATAPVFARTAMLLGIGALAGALLGVLGWRWLAPPGAVHPSVTRLSIVAPPGQELLSANLSPDGSTLALRMRPRGDRQSPPRLYLRPLSSFDPRPVAESEAAIGFSFSPDSRWFYFVAPLARNATQLRVARVPVDGSSAPVTVRRWEESWTRGTLLPDGDILASTEQGRKFVRLPASGADPPPASPFVTDLEGAGFAFTDERLPDGSPMLVVQHYGSRGYQDGVASLDLASGKVHLLVDDAFYGVPLASGQLVFGRGDALLVAPFDAASLKVTDAPRSVLTGLRTVDDGEPYPRFELARNGTLLYAPGGRVGAGRHLVMVDAKGAITPWSSDRMPLQLEISSAPNGRLAQTAMEPNGLLFEIWIADLESPTLRRLVTTPGVDNHQPVLSRDGTRLAFRRYGRSAQDGLYVRSVEGAGGERRLAAITSTLGYVPLDWSPDGSRLLARRYDNGRLDVVSFSPDGDPAEPQPLLASSFDESDARFAPDGRALAFVSNENGREEVYVAALAADGNVGSSVAVSAGPGLSPHWRPDGRAVLFHDGQNHIMSVPVTTAPRIVAGAPEVLLDLDKLGLTHAYDVLPDGRLIVVARGEEEGEIPRYDLVLGFTSELTRGGKQP
jgi:hypothetical protein